MSTTFTSTMFNARPGDNPHVKRKSRPEENPLAARSPKNDAERAA
jgi:hypothetical protein